MQLYGKGKRWSKIDHVILVFEYSISLIREEKGNVSNSLLYTIIDLNSSKRLNQKTSLLGGRPHKQKYHTLIA